MRHLNNWFKTLLDLKGPKHSDKATNLNYLKMFAFNNSFNVWNEIILSTNEMITKKCIFYIEHTFITCKNLWAQSFEAHYTSSAL